MEDQPTDQAPELPDEQAPNPDLRAARVRIDTLASDLREALTADDELSGQTKGRDRE